MRREGTGAIATVERIVAVQHGWAVHQPPGHQVGREDRPAREVDAAGDFEKLSTFVFSKTSFKNHMRMWRNWQTRQVEGLMPIFGRGGSNPLIRT